MEGREGQGEGDRGLIWLMLEMIIEESVYLLGHSLTHKNAHDSYDSRVE